jgi:exosome complex component RRP4
MRFFVSLYIKIILVFFELGQGNLITVSSQLIKRQKVHFVSLPCGISIILGLNGYIWVTTSLIQENARKNGGFTPNTQVRVMEV